VNQTTLTAGGSTGWPVNVIIHSPEEKVCLMKRTWIVTLGVLLLASLLPAGAQEKPTAQKPNIILILSDDVGLGDIGCYGGAFKTPQIDSLAKGGTRFEYCYSTPLCGPSRCQLLTAVIPSAPG